MNYARLSGTGPVSPASVKIKAVSSVKTDESPFEGIGTESSQSCSRSGLGPPGMPAL
jgi:hypothetical protein